MMRIFPILVLGFLAISCGKLLESSPPSKVVADQTHSSALEKSSSDNKFPSSKKTDLPVYTEDQLFTARAERNRLETIALQLREEYANTFNEKNHTPFMLREACARALAAAEKYRDEWAQYIEKFGKGFLLQKKNGETQTFQAFSDASVKEFLGKAQDAVDALKKDLATYE